MQAQEIERAAEWLVAELLPADSPKRGDLAASIQGELEERYDGHWYPAEPHRGCAYRSLTFNVELDPLLVRALRRAGVGRDRLVSKNPFILWVNPGEVKLLEAGVKRHVYIAHGLTPNPYSKPKVRIEPTRLNVSASEEGRSRDISSCSSSPASNSPAGSPKQSPKSSPAASKQLSPAAANFVPSRPPKGSASASAASGSSQSSDTSDSDGETDAQVAHLEQPPPFALGAQPPPLFWPVAPPGMMAPWPLPQQPPPPFWPYAVRAF